jgi:hypothetical protein
VYVVFLYYKLFLNMCTILQGKELKQNVREGVIMGNHSLGKDDVD